MLSKMHFKQLYDKGTGTYTYILGDEETKECIIIDPVIELVERDLGFVNELGYKLKYALDTHVHADHVSGVYTQLKTFKDAVGVYGINTGVDKNVLQRVMLVKEGDKIFFGKNFYLSVYETPGHTAGCVSFFFPGRTEGWGYNDMVFTGDMMLIRACGRTDFQGGSTVQLYESAQKLYKELNDDCIVYPGHNYEGVSNSYIGEEKKFSRRLRADMSKEEFSEMMKEVTSSLELPKRIHFSVPANFYGGVMAAQHLYDRFYVAATLSRDAIRIMKEKDKIDTIVHFPVPGQKLNVKAICEEFKIKYVVLKGWKPPTFTNAKCDEFVRLIDTLEGKILVTCKTENRSRFFMYYYFKKKGINEPLAKTLEWVYGKMMKGWLVDDEGLDVHDYFVREAKKLGKSILQLAKPGAFVGHSECGM